MPTTMTSPSIASSLEESCCRKAKSSNGRGEPRDGRHGRRRLDAAEHAPRSASVPVPSPSACTLAVTRRRSSSIVDGATEPSSSDVRVRASANLRRAQRPATSGRSSTGCRGRMDEKRRRSCLCQPPRGSSWCWFVAAGIRPRTGSSHASTRTERTLGVMAPHPRQFLATVVRRCTRSPISPTPTGDHDAAEDATLCW